MRLHGHAVPGKTMKTDEQASPVDQHFRTRLHERWDLDGIFAGGSASPRFAAFLRQLDRDIAGLAASVRDLAVGAAAATGSPIDPQVRGGPRVEPPDPVARTGDPRLPDAPAPDAPVPDAPVPDAPAPDPVVTDLPARVDPTAPAAAAMSPPADPEADSVDGAPFLEPREWVGLVEAWQARAAELNQAYSFVECLAAADTADAVATQLGGRLDALEATLKSVEVALDQRLLALTDDAWQRLCGEPELAPIRFLLERRRALARRKMDAAREALAETLATTGYHAWGRLYDKLAGSLRAEVATAGEGREPTAGLSIGQLVHRLEDADRGVRAEAFQRLEGAWRSVQDLAAMALNSQAGFRLSLYAGRGWDSILWEPLHVNRLRRETLEAMWSAVAAKSSGLLPYLEAKASYLGLDRMRWADLLAPVGQTGANGNGEDAYAKRGAVTGVPGTATGGRASVHDERGNPTGERGNPTGERGNAHGTRGHGRSEPGSPIGNRGTPTGERSDPHGEPDDAHCTAGASGTAGGHSPAEGQRQFSYPAAADYILRQFGAFSGELEQFARRAFSGRWIEVEDRSGKAAGGFCTDLPLSGETRIFMTFGGTFGGVSTLAHELGHAYHAWLLRDRPYFATIYPMALAETASTFCETLIMDAALDAAGPAEELALLGNIGDEAVTMLMNLRARFLFECAFFDRRSAGPLTADELSALMVEAQRAAYCDALAPDGYHPLFWASKLHFYITSMPFYNFPYVFGYLFSNGLSARARAEGAGFAPAYARLLRDTGSMTCEELAQRHLGVDLSQPAFWEGAVDRVLEVVPRFIAAAAGASAQRR